MKRTGQQTTCAVFAALMLATSAGAEPVKLQCDTIGSRAKFWGKLTLTVDLVARRVLVDSQRHKMFGADYQDGVFAPVHKASVVAAYEEEPVAQFVNVRPDRVEVGWRTKEGELEYLAYFNRSALHGARCRWHSLSQFDVAEAGN
jgi:hypothetical protein